MPTWNSEHTAIFQHLIESPKGLQVDAVAGSGKTTTGVEITHRLSAATGKALATAFNKSNALTLEKRFPASWTCATFNSLGHRTWARTLRKRLSLETGKAFGLIDTFFPDAERDDKYALKNILDRARLASIVPKGSVGTRTDFAMSENPEQWIDFIETENLEASEDTIRTLRKALKHSIELGFRGKIDFTDQLYLPTCFASPWDTYDTLLVDEAQDLSPQQHEMVAQSLAAKGRLISLGDTHQAIYGFRGALSNSMEAFRDRFNLESYRLSTSYRCSKAVVREAQRFVPYIRALPDAPQGRFQNLTQFNDYLNLMDLPDSSAILCRNNAPLFKLAWPLLRQARPVKIAGRDFERSLTSLIKKISKKQEQLPIPQFLSLLQRWEEHEIATADGKKWKIQAAEEKAQCLHALASEHLRTVRDLLNLIEKLFSEGASRAITLSSIHRSKGFEWEDVYLLDPGRLPSPFAETEEELQQEANLHYVAITRSLRNLTYVDLEQVL